MKVLVIGASGLVGHHVARLANRRGYETLGTSCHTPVAGLVPLDITSLDECYTLITAEHPDAIVLAAAYSHVDGCERNPERARAVNVTGVANVLESANESGSTVVWFSSDDVFDGQDGPYREESSIKPLNIYGATKAESERLVLAYPHRSLVLRTATVFGIDPGLRNFAMQILNRARHGETIPVANDEFTTPTYAPDLAAVALSLIEKGHRGIFNVTGSTWMDRAAFASSVLQAFDLSPALVFGTSNVVTSHMAARPRKCGLLTSKLQSVLGQTPRPVPEALKDMREHWTAYEACWQD